MNINSVVISGNLTRDPEIRTTQTGTAVLMFGIAVNDRRKNNRTGEWEDYANFIDCTMFGSRAQNIAQYLSKGSKVTIEGKLRWSQWERDGQKRSKIDVVVKDIDLVSSRGGDRQDGYSQQSSDEFAYSAPSTPVVDTYPVYDEDIPF